MKNSVVIVLGILSVLCPVAAGQSDRLANAGKDGLRATSLDQVLRLSDDEIDVGTAALIASEYWSNVVAGRRYLEQLDAMATEVRSRLIKQRIPFNQQAIPVLNDYLFKELGFTTIPNAKDPNDLFLHTVLDRKRGYCLSLSVLYLSLAERIGLQVYGVVVPGHFFVRFDSGSRVRFNIETTDNGSSPPDQHYITKFKMPQNYASTIYLRNLTKRQTLGCFFNNLGSVYADVGNLNMAMQALERAVLINPTLPESRTNLAGVYMRQGRTQDALVQYQMAIQLNPNDPLILLNLGGAYAGLNRSLEAITSFQQALALDPNLVLAHRNLASVYTRQGRYMEAMNELQTALRFDQNNALIHGQLGDVCYRRHEVRPAITELTKALKLKPDYAEAMIELGQCYEELGQTSDAIETYKKAVALRPDSADALQALGNVYFKQKNYDVAVECFSKAVSAKPDDPWTYFNLAASYSNKNDFANSIKAYGEAVRLDPTIGQAYVGLAYGCYMLKQYDAAWQNIAAARKLGVQVQDDLVKAVQSMLKTK
jgi:tetratricopeptide (TPR) repeat protein